MARKVAEDDKKKDRIVTPVSEAFKEEYFKMCDNIGEVPSAHLQQIMEGELALYKVNRG